MTLGERIRTLRSGKNLSQEDLAAALEVSRQSVSKWETDASVPDLEKLVKMSDLFGVSLDALVRGKTAMPQPAESVPLQKQKVPGQKTAGIVLLCLAVITLWIGLLLDGSLLLGLVFSIPLGLCGLICLTVQWHPDLLCTWLITVLGDTFMMSAMRCSWRPMLRNLYLYGFAWLDADWKWFDVSMTLLQPGWIVFLMVWLGKCLLPDIPPLNRKKRDLLCGGWLLFVLLHVTWLFVVTHTILAVPVEWLRFALLSVLLTCAVSDRRQKKGAVS